MPIVVDTGPIYSLADRSDNHHDMITRFFQRNRELLIMPVTVVPEVGHLLKKRLGQEAVQSFVHSLAMGEIRVETVNYLDIRRIDELLTQYADSKLDVVDASVIALAERMDIVQVLTVDYRDFSIVRPRHCPALEILP
jgi:predicted nucleic acid-binding protein